MRTFVPWQVDSGPGKKPECQTRTISYRSFVFERVVSGLSADSLVMAKAAFPHVVGATPHEEDPARLDGKGLPHLGAAEAFHENRDGTKKFVIERKPFQGGLDAGRHD